MHNSFVLVPTLILLLSLTAFSQEIGIYSSFSYDEATRQAHVYGATTSDYSTAYYYEIYVGLSLEFNTGQHVCTGHEGWEYNYSTVERSCDYTVPGDVTRIDFVTTHYLNTTYYYYQIEYCEFGCTGWGDMYGYSLTSTGSGMNSDNQVIYPPGQLLEIQFQTAKSGNILRTKFPTCTPPTGESTVPEGWGSYNYGQDYVSLFKVSLLGTGYFDLRYVTESLSWAYPFTSTFPSIHSDGCHFPGSAYFPEIPEEGYWTVGSVTGPFNYYVESRSFGYDGLGLVRPKLMHYLERLRSTGTNSCSIRYMQQMSFSCIPGNFNDLRWYKNNQLTITLQQYGVTNQRDNSSSSKVIP
jgi:hypothetical protein